MTAEIQHISSNKIANLSSQGGKTMLINLTTISHELKNGKNYETAQ